MQDLELEVKYMEDIVLVTGYHRTRSYTNAIFSESQDGAQVSLGVRVGGFGVNVEWRSFGEQTGGVLVNCGPSGPVRPFSQCDDCNLGQLFPHIDGFRTFLRINVSSCEGSVPLVSLGYSRQHSEGLQNPVQIQTHTILGQTKNPYLSPPVHVIM